VKLIHHKTIKAKPMNKEIRFRWQLFSNHVLPSMTRVKILVNYSVDCCVTFQGDIEGLKKDDFQVVEGFEIMIRESPAINLTMLSEDLIDLDFIMYTAQPSFEDALSFAYANMSKCLIYPERLQVHNTSSQGVYNESGVFWEEVY
jgi:hypothetical protein